MKISLLTLGTRGDVQPFAVLAKAFQSRGHEVVLSTGKNFDGMAKEYGIAFHPVEADFQALINSDEGKAMMKNPFLARKHFVSIIQPMMVGAMQTFYKVAQESDCVLFHVKSLGDFFADQFPEKMVRANVVPALQPTSEFPNPVFAALPLPRALNKFTYRLANLGMGMMNNAIREFRIGAGLSEKYPGNINLPSIYGISPHFLPKPKDYPSNSYFTGFWQRQSTATIDPGIIDFLSSGKKNLLITFGSMSFETRFDLQRSLIDIARDFNVNIVIVKGWGFNETSALNDNQSIKVIENAPFDQLFSKVNAVIHHGGIGTAAECLKAGVPFLSCPVIHPLGDQYFWGMQSHKLGCSPPPVPLRKLQYNSLKENVSTLLTSDVLRYNARQISKQLSSENGTDGAVDIVEAVLNT